MLVRKAAGVILIAAGAGLAAISGVLAYNGFETMIKIPFAGWIGPCVAASLIGLGIAVESEIRHRRWVAALVLFALLCCAGGLDRHSGELALQSKVEAAKQVFSDRDAKYTTAVDSKAKAEKLIADLEAELVVMTGDDIKKAQLRLAALGEYVDANGKPMKIDGERGDRTLQGMATRGNEIRAALVTARDDLKKATDTVAAGAPKSEVPFNLSDAALYATLITGLSIILAFAGSYVFAGFEKEETIDDELGELEDAMSGVEAEIFDIVDFMGEQKQSRKKQRRA